MTLFSESYMLHIYNSLKFILIIKSWYRLEYCTEPCMCVHFLCLFNVATYFNTMYMDCEWMVLSQIWYNAMPHVEDERVRASLCYVSMYWLSICILRRGQLCRIIEWEYKTHEKQNATKWNWQRLHESGIYSTFNVPRGSSLPKRDKHSFYVKSTFQLLTSLTLFYILWTKLIYVDTYNKIWTTDLCLDNFITKFNYIVTNIN